MSDIISPERFAFVSANGHIIGIGEAPHDSIQPNEGVAVALLQSPTTLIDWLDTLHGTEDLELAVEKMLGLHGGERICRPMDLTKATFVPFMGNVVGEA